MPDGSTLSREYNTVEITKDELDPLGDPVKKIYVRTERYTVYRAETHAGDFTGLRYVIQGNYEDCVPLRRTLAPVVCPVAQIAAVASGIRRKPFWRKAHRFSEGCLELMAKAMQIALDGDTPRALAMLEALRAEVEIRRDSHNRMRYIFANFLAIVAILLVWAVVHARGWQEPGLLWAFVTGSLPAVTEGSVPPPLNYTDVVVLGALGAFFSVSIGLKTLKMAHAITMWEMIYGGVVRILIGVIAATAIVMMIEGGWLLGSISPNFKHWAIYLFGFLAGFSELFVPNALRQAEASGPVKSPEASAVP